MTELLVLHDISYRHGKSLSCQSIVSSRSCGGFFLALLAPALVPMSQNILSKHLDKSQN